MINFDNIPKNSFKISFHSTKKKNGERVTSESNQHHRYTDCINEIKQIIARNKKNFYFCGKEVSWEEIPIDVRKHDYPYYFDDNGNDCFPIVTDKRLK